jgi:hypothetical protein
MGDYQCRAAPVMISRDTTRLFRLMIASGFGRLRLP